MDRSLVEAKLESLRRCVERIAAKTPSAADQLAQNPDLQDIIALNLQRAVQLSVDLASHLIAETDARPPSTPKRLPNDSIPTKNIWISYLCATS
ncbi:MAG: HepT-like ribonuclease domain-containing protein [Nitrospirales bacterium]